jgi:hypothetical protein
MTLVADWVTVTVAFVASSAEVAVLAHARPAMEVVPSALCRSVQPEGPV